MSFSNNKCLQKLILQLIASVLLTALPVNLVAFSLGLKATGLLRVVGLLGICPLLDLSSS